mmetsp:Transcript_7199/g.23762  ORF Transcript_7199/g.23762 Transcript_7199/m.23762 type:complete len:201 (+) Transcript_7199:396-998(+)
MSGSTWPAASRGTCSSSSGDSARTVARKAEAAWRKEAGRPVLWSPGKLTSVFSPPRAADMHLEWCGRTRVSLSAVATSAGIWQAGAASMGRHLYKSNPARFHTEEATTRSAVLTRKGGTFLTGPSLARPSPSGPPTTSSTATCSSDAKGESRTRPVTLESRAPTMTAEDAPMLRPHSATGPTPALSRSQAMMSCTSSRSK